MLFRSKKTTGKEKWIVEKNFVKRHRKFGKKPFNMYPLNILFEIIYNIHYTSKYIYNQFRSNAIKFKNIIPDSSKIFLKKLKSKFLKYDTLLEMGFKNDFGFVKLPSIKNSHIYSDSQLKKLNFGQNEIKALKKLYSPKTNNNLYENKIFNKAKKIFYKKFNNEEKLLNHEIYTRVTSNYSKS